MATAFAIDTFLEKDIFFNMKFSLDFCIGINDVVDQQLSLAFLTINLKQLT